MHIPDVNVIVDAWNAGSRHHGPARRWLETHANDGAVGLPDVVAAGAVRVLTLEVPGLHADLAPVLERFTALRAATGVQAIHPGRRHWGIFDSLCRQFGATGNAVPDCYLAALAIEKGATFVSRDRFFARVPELDWIDLPAS